MKRRKYVVFAIMVTVAILIASPSFMHFRRAAQFKSVCDLVKNHGGSLSFDLQGDYSLSLNGSAANDETIDTLLPHLRTRPTGFTIVGPGEGRHFYVKIHDSNITARGVAGICSLSVTSIALTQCPNLDDTTVDALITLRNPFAIINGDVRLSPEALSRLRKRMPDAFPNLRVAGEPRQENGDDELNRHPS